MGIDKGSGWSGEEGAGGGKAAAALLLAPSASGVWPAAWGLLLGQ